MDRLSHVALDPVIQSVLDQQQAQQLPSLFAIPIGQARERMRLAVTAARQRLGAPAVASAEDLMAVDAGHTVPVRVYRPAATTAPRPTLVFFHGGGFALGSIESADTLCRHLCRRLDAVVVSADYRLAPEHPFPAAHDDALAVGRWALRQVAHLGGDAGRVVVGGESAGANLATSTALRTLDGPTRFAAQWLVVPGVDFARDLGVLRASAESFPLLTPDDLQAISRLYLGAASHRAGHFPPSPLHAPSFQGLPPAVIAVAGHDHLRGEGLAYAAALRADGVPVDVVELADMPHPFLAFLGASAGVGHALERACGPLRALLQTPFASSLNPIPPHNKETP
jgi:acetyl esterase